MNPILPVLVPEHAHSYRTPALFLVFLQVIIFVALIDDSATRPLLVWYCNNISLFLAIAFWWGDMQMVKGLSYVGILTQLLWITDFLAHLVGFDLSNTANYIFLGGLTFANDVSIVVHFTIPLIVLWYTASIRPEPRSLLNAIGLIFILFIATLLLTSASDDVNCVYLMCGQQHLPYRIYLWPFYSCLLSIAAYAFHEALYIFYPKKGLQKDC